MSHIAGDNDGEVTYKVPTMNIITGPVIAFTGVRKPFGWCSNMSPHPIVVDGAVWKTAEALFQALRFNDHAIQEEIRRERSPMSAKWIANAALKAHKEAVVVVPRSEDDIDNMRIVLAFKFRQHADIRRELRATGDAIIVEDTTRRANESGLYWGARQLADGTWEGNNQLGKLLMELRDSYKR